MRLDDLDFRSNEDIIQELEGMGIQVIYEPMALVPDTLESSMMLGEQSYGLVKMDIHEALRKIKIRKSIIGDPFSKY